MRILLASSEVHPFSKTGGLADMVGSLSKALASDGHQVGIVSPLYMGIREKYPNLALLDMPLDIALGVSRARGEVWALEYAPNLTAYFVDQPGFFQRPTLYTRDGMDYPDNAERFIFFSKAVTHLAVHLPWKPEILHANDWQSGFATLFLEQLRRLPEWRNAPKACFTIHNLAYQGVFPASQYLLTNLPWTYFVPELVEFHGQVNCLKAGVAGADVITTVSPRYAREITTEEFGCGLDGLLRHRQASLKGILNGVDYEEWNPATDPYITTHFTPDDLVAKAVNKATLQQEFGLPVDSAIPLFGNIGRMVQQKGVDILLGALEELLSSNIQFVQLGTGTPEFQRAFQGLTARYPGKAAVRIGFDEGLSHRIEAGCDFFLMPSHFEPCGLNQMYSLRYGTIPVVRAVGGLDDTVVDLRDDAERATGIKFHEYSSRALVKAMRKALALYNAPVLLERFRRNGMQTDFSWRRTAKQFVALYQRAVKAHPLRQLPAAL